jgi:hypothetical protein
MGFNGPVFMSLFQLRIDCREPMQESVSRIAWPALWPEIHQAAGADGGKY